mgnify:CR=1 FL=1
MAEIEYLINKHYYEEPEDIGELVDMALTGYVAGLGDVYSCYNDIEDTKEADNNHAGFYVGIGITVTMSAEGYIEIIEIPQNSPSLEAGLQVGDIIIPNECVADTCCFVDNVLFHFCYLLCIPFCFAFSLDFALRSSE